MKVDANYFKSVYPKIIEALRLVAAPASVQLSSLPKHVCKPDEIAFTFEEIMIYAKILMENKFLSIDLYLQLLAIDKLFENLKKDEWTEDSLHKSKSWEVVRTKAIEVLKNFGEGYTAPNLFWATSIPKDRG